MLGRALRTGFRAVPIMRRARAVGAISTTNGSAFRRSGHRARGTVTFSTASKPAELDGSDGSSTGVGVPV